MFYKIILQSFIALAFIFSGTAAQDLTLSLTSIEQFKIDGEANVRDWDADITEANGTLQLNGVENLSLDSLTPESISSLTITIPVSGIESDSRRLTNNLQDYLKKDDHPEITFRLTDINSVVKNNNSASITANGTVNAAGVNKNITMNVDAVVNGNGSISFRGSQDLLMTDFNIDPPTAVMGTVRARDEIKILFNVTFN
jgi:hypothetical protein